MNDSNAEKIIEVKLCMGSSCFSRGNNTALKLLQDYVGNQGLQDNVVISGSLCEELCNTGPHMFVDGEHYCNVDPSTVIDLLKLHLKKLANN